MMEPSLKAAVNFEDPSNHTATTSSSDDDDTEAHHVVKETHFHTSRMRDSVAVQKKHGTVNDCEVHEENPHLEDFMVKNHSFHIAGMSMEEAAAKMEAANAAAKAARIAEAAAAADADEDTTTREGGIARRRGSSWFGVGWGHLAASGGSVGADRLQPSVFPSPVPSSIVILSCMISSITTSRSDIPLRSTRGRAPSMISPRRRWMRPAMVRASQRKSG